MEQFTIGQVAERTGLSTSTLRYYESRGVVAPSTRTDAGYRLYDERSLARLGFVARAKELDCTLLEIVDLAALWESDACGPVQAQLHALVSDKIARAQRRTVDLIELTSQLQQAATKLADPPSDGPCGPSCACLSDRAVAPNPGPIAQGPAADQAISCTLATDQVEDRVSAWQTALTHVKQRTTTSDGALRLTLDDETSIHQLTQLAQAEQGCCSFFSFAITVDSRGLALEVRAPDDAIEVVTAVFGSPGADADPTPAGIS